MTSYNGHSIARKQILAGFVAVGLCLAWSLPADAQRGSAPGVELDPISFRGPDPGKRFQDIRIEQKLEAQVPLDLQFTDDQGREVTLQDYFGEKPVVIGLVYYECPSLCNLVMNGMLSAFDGSANKLELGEDYTALSVSIDPRETVEQAAAKKASYLEEFHREGGQEGWHFLTGDEENIETLANAVGYRYYYDETTDQWAHDSGIIIVTPSGVVSSYYLGIEYLPRKLQFSLMEAADENIGSLMDQIVRLCYVYDPTQGAYGLSIMRTVRLAGVATMSALALFWIVMFLRKRGLSKNSGHNSTDGSAGGSDQHPGAEPRTT